MILPSAFYFTGYLRIFSVPFAICICNLWIGTGYWPRNLGSMWQ